MRQNTSHAVMAQRFEAADSLDNFPTPPWATRALMEHVLNYSSQEDCLEPACGEGHMAKVLENYFNCVQASDIFDYGYGMTRNFLTYPYEPKSFDWVITNPPFRLAEEFVLKALQISRIGVAVLTRTVFLESAGRYRTLFKDNPPDKFAQFVERVPMVKGRLEKEASTATGYAWLVWEIFKGPFPRLMWIPPCRKELEREGDYPPKIKSSINLDDLEI